MNAQIKRTFDRQHLLGTIFILIAVLMVIQGLWLQYTKDQEASCQANYNSDVSAVVAQRAQWADEDRHALNTMISTVINPDNTEQERQQALQQYAETAAKNDANRQANPLPSKTRCN